MFLIYFGEYVMKIIYEKNCEQCASLFKKGKYMTVSQFENSKFCSIECENKNFISKHSDNEFLDFEKKFSINKENGCWEWIGPLHPTGRGYYKGTTAARKSYNLYIGAIPEKSQVFLSCGNSKCVNPNHLTIEIDKKLIPEEKVCKVCGSKYTRRRDSGKLTCLRQWEKSTVCGMNCSRQLAREAVKRKWDIPPEVRFWEKVDVEDRNLSIDKCWEWKGSRTETNYGQFRSMGTTVLAHRFSYELHKGKIPEGLFVRHHCDNPPCVNPNHLEVGTARDNNDDKKKRGRSRNGKRTRDWVVIEVYKAEGSCSKIAKKFGMSKEVVRKIKRKLNFKDLIEEYEAYVRSSVNGDKE